MTQMRVLSTTEGRLSLQPGKGFMPVIKGVGNVNLECGGCNAALVQGLEPGQWRGQALVCPLCGAINALDA
jgi:hypothetical protein